MRCRCHCASPIVNHVGHNLNAFVPGAKMGGIQAGVGMGGLTETLSRGLVGEKHAKYRPVLESVRYGLKKGTGGTDLHP